MCGANCDGFFLVRTFTAVVLTALTVRWMDDWVDGEGWAEDGPTSEGTRAVYSLLALALACALDATRAVALFLCSYAVGMLTAAGGRLPLGLSPRAESVGAVVAAGWASGWPMALTALGSVIAIQAADDIHDLSRDVRNGTDNWAHRWGTVETGVVGFLGLLVAARLDPVLTVQAFGAVAVVETVSTRWPWARALTSARESFGPDDDDFGVGDGLRENDPGGVCPHAPEASGDIGVERR